VRIEKKTKVKNIFKFFFRQNQVGEEEVSQKKFDSIQTQSCMELEISKLFSFLITILKLKKTLARNAAELM